MEGLSPRVEGGRFEAKRALGDVVEVEADAFTDGHDALAVRLCCRGPGAAAWTEIAMRALPNDRFAATFTPDRLGLWHYAVEAWVDPFETWRRDLGKRVAARQDVGVDLEIGARLVADAAERADGDDADALAAAAARLRDAAAELEARLELALGAELAAVIERHPDRRSATRTADVPVRVDPELARFGAWYEMFPRSASADPDRHGTFADVEALLPYVAGMGFDVLYLPPVHPVGRTFRKGPNNAERSEPQDLGSPWAIGGAEGGHTAIHPELGTEEDFVRLVRKARERGIEVAMDVAFQASPDHPWVREHPEWFRSRPDGTIQYAENPPKKYQDIYPFDFECEDWLGLWRALLSVFEHWIGRGVRVFRVDNPHTKPFPFWEWAIARLKGAHPEVILLSEAFTRPKPMYRLAKLGFSQSYTYFAWRTFKDELEAYFTELTSPAVADFFRPNLWPNTPDILTAQMQTGGRAVFAQRLVLAATLGASYGIYGPAFELFEGRPAKAGSEEYLDSEKYQRRVWDRDRPDSLRELVARVNRIRRENPALHRNERLAFHRVDNERLIAYSKHTADLANVVLVVVNLDPVHVQSGWVELPLGALGIEEEHPYQVHDLLTGARYLWQGPRNFVQLDPHTVPAHLFRVRRRVRSEVDFDYYA